MRYRLQKRLFASRDDGSLADLPSGTVVTILHTMPPNEVLVRWENGIGQLFLEDVAEHCVRIGTQSQNAGIGAQWDKSAATASKRAASK